DDPLTVVEKRTRQLAALTQAERATRAAAQAAERSLRDARKLRDQILANAGKTQTTLSAVSLRPVAAQTHTIEPTLTGPAEPALPEPADLPSLVAAARSRADAATGYAEALAAAARRRAESEPGFLREAAALVDG